MIFLGVDPGESGGLALVGAKPNDPVRAVALKRLTEHDIATFLREWEPKIAWTCVEKVASRPGQGVASTFKFGKSYGFLRGCLVSNRIAFQDVTPVKWQRRVGIKKVKGESIIQKKNRHKALVQQLYPRIKVTHQTADAILIARYAKMECLNHLGRGLETLH